MNYFRSHYPRITMLAILLVDHFPRRCSGDATRIVPTRTLLLLEPDHRVTADHTHSERLIESARSPPRPGSIPGSARILDNIFEPQDLDKSSVSPSSFPEDQLLLKERSHIQSSQNVEQKKSSGSEISKDSSTTKLLPAICFLVAGVSIVGLVTWCFATEFLKRRDASTSDSPENCPDQSIISELSCPLFFVDNISLRDDDASSVSSLSTDIAKRLVFPSDDLEKAFPVYPQLRNQSDWQAELRELITNAASSSSSSSDGTSQSKNSSIRRSGPLLIGQSTISDREVCWAAALGGERVYVALATPDSDSWQSSDVNESCRKTPISPRDWDHSSVSEVGILESPSSTMPTSESLTVSSGHRDIDDYDDGLQSEHNQEPGNSVCNYIRGIQHRFSGANSVAALGSSNESIHRNRATTEQTKISFDKAAIRKCTSILIGRLTCENEVLLADSFIADGEPSLSSGYVDEVKEAAESLFGSPWEIIA